jgi:hypothetical protein
MNAIRRMLRASVVGGRDVTRGGWLDAYFRLLSTFSK